MSRDFWNKCDVCGKFIAYGDFYGVASRRLLTPDSHFSSETYETLCGEHYKELIRKMDTERENEDSFR